MVKSYFDILKAFSNSRNHDNIFPDWNVIIEYCSSYRIMSEVTDY